MRNFRTISVFAATALVAAVGCSTGEDSAVTQGATTDADKVTVVDAWVRAADDGMVPAFAELTNEGGDDVQITGVSSTVSPVAEIHEVVTLGGQPVMQEKPDGITIAAGHTHVLEPGSDHFMLMGLSDPITPGSQVVIILEFDDGSTQDVSFSGRNFAGGNENYAPMDHSTTEDHSDHETQ
ncbi:copper chaperone PCu(A)C [Hoyosella rhizosphaerae]|uniref:Copper chaperone PCu(A)C n=1 Tax=Hoyosella rhizosphaerae TaxID=1755582 RepID=A0A916U7M1_9ACTN|nr:copper chaperone PCu(A)C [Hoyosella rhizosphaerae]MBN4927715.1 copper chaperone PCu(A)C [Hoyosella rhizosphaerae]GGC62178.1 hypothetical protein GCM10011410_13280 [Hoyosella rhizosphaerae]